MEDINVLALVKGSEKYIVLYADVDRDEASRAIGRWAANSDLSFTWYDAHVLCARLRGQPERS